MSAGVGDRDCREEGGCDPMIMGMTFDSGTARFVTVDGVEYDAQWGPRTRAGIEPPVVTFLLEHAETPGSLLRVSWTLSSGPQPDHLDDTVVTASVRIALRLGWRPTAPEPEFGLGLTDQDLSL
jgi:hypothetical protein